MSDNSDRSAFLNLLAGIGIGAILGAVTAIMLAPKPGEETREDIRKTADELKTKAEKLVSDISASTDELVDKSKEMIEAAKAKVQQAVDAGKQAMAEKREALSGQSKKESEG